MAYGESNGHVSDYVTWPQKVLWGRTVGYRSDSLASCFFHVAKWVKLCTHNCYLVSLESMQYRWSAAGVPRCVNRPHDELIEHSASCYHQLRPPAANQQCRVAETTATIKSMTCVYYNHQQQHIQCESKKIPPAVFWHFFQTDGNFLINFCTPTIRSFLH